MQKPLLHSVGKKDGHEFEEEGNYQGALANFDDLHTVNRLGRQEVTLNQCMEIFKGSCNARVLQAGHDTLPEHGKGMFISFGTSIFYSSPNLMRQYGVHLPEYFRLEYY